MLTALRQGRVAGLRVTVACAHSLDTIPHDVYLLDLAPVAPGGPARFDEVPYLERLEPVLDAAGGPPAWVVDVSRSHRSDRDGIGWAHVTVHLEIAGASSLLEPAPDLTAVVQSAFSAMTQLGAAPVEARALGRGEAIDAATAAVEHGFGDVDPNALSLTDEEHDAALGRWAVGLAVPGVTRFQVQLGFVPGAPGSAHVHRMPLSEVVDSVGP
jgi:hypothetical protein